MVFEPGGWFNEDRLHPEYLLTGVLTWQVTPYKDHAYLSSHNRTWKPGIITLSPDEFRFARLAPRIARAPLTLSLGLALAACGGGAGQADLASAGNITAPTRANGPSADFPVVVGAPYFVGSTEYEPADVLSEWGIGQGLSEPNQPLGSGGGGAAGDRSPDGWDPQREANR